MKPDFKKSIMILMCLVTFSASVGQAESEDEQTLSPYFFIKSDDPETDRLPLKSTSVYVNLVGIIADVTVNQVYKNEGKRPIEAIYVFPASTRAAIYGMKMTIGARTIIATIQKKEEARREYEQAKKAGKSASLLEQHRPNVFQMNVANILPSDVINVEMKYTELLVPVDAAYEFVYPTVVGPRYVGHSDKDSWRQESWTKNPYLHQGEIPTYSFSMAMNISAGLPIQDVHSPSHKIDVQYLGPDRAKVLLHPLEKNGGNRDFILKYRLSGNQIQTGLLLSEGEKENFFLLMVQPPREVSSEEIPPREYMFIVDISGSMHGFPLDISKKLLRELLENLRQTDRFNLLLFAGSSSVLSEKSLPATNEHIRLAIETIERRQGGGGTELLPALKRAMGMPKEEGFSRTIVIATDGYVAVEAEVFDLIRKSLGKANIFPFGIGTSVNRHLIEGMARAGMGEAFVVIKPGNAIQKAKEFKKLIEKPVLTGIRIDYGNFETYDIEPPVTGDVLAERPIIVFGKWRGKPNGVIRLNGITGDRPFSKAINVSVFSPERQNEALRFLWARHRIAFLSDYNLLKPDDGRIEEVTRLGLAYNLLTAYTSFVAIDTQVRLENGKAITVKQPLPLPQGVSDLAVGGGAGGGAFKSLAAPQSVSGLGRRVLTEEARTDSADKPMTTLQLQKVTVKGGLSIPLVQPIVERHFGVLEACIREHFKNGGGRKRDFEIVFFIKPDGNIEKVEVKGLAEPTDPFQECIAIKMVNVIFPNPSGGDKATITVAVTIN